MKENYKDWFKFFVVVSCISLPFAIWKWIDISVYIMRYLVFKY